MFLNDEQKEIVLKNTKLVYYVMSKKLDIPQSDFEDVSQIGMIGLIKAVKSFDEKKGIRFSTFATMCIRNEILMFYRKENPRRAGVISIEEALFGNKDNEDGNTNNIASKISEDFPFARIDLYSVEGKVYFGEITFYPWSGYMEFEPDEFDFVLGKPFNINCGGT